jgi:hypothetical protein
MLVLRRLSLALAEKLGKPYEQQLIIIRAPQSYEVARAELKYHGGYQHVQQHPY